MEKFDVAVIGSGPGGYEAAFNSARYGLKTVLIESRELGGTCLNRGCIPTKSLLQGAKVYETVSSADKYGISIDGFNIRYDKLVEYKNSIVNKLRRGIESTANKLGVTIVYGFAVLKDKHTIDVEGIFIKADNIILATGSSPAHPPIPGINGENVINSDKVLELKYCPKSLVIVGGGVIGIEFATLFSSLNAKVIVVEMEDNILSGIDSEITKKVSQILSRKGVEFYTGAKVTSIENEKLVKVNYEHQGIMKSSNGEYCVICTGRIAHTQNMGLENIGIKTNHRFVEVDDFMRTSIPNIYAIGDITGKIQLAHVATAQGLVASANCAGKTERMDYNIVPVCIYTSIEVASVGITADIAMEEGRNIKVGIYNVPFNGKTIILGCQNGIIKIVSDAKTGEILGAQIMAPHATDMISEICVAMKCEGTIHELAKSIHPHPSVSEIIMEAARSVEVSGNI